MTDTLRWLGFVAGTLTVGSFLPQVVRAWSTRQTRDLSLAMFALLVTASSLWAFYGFVQRDWPVVITNLGMASLNLALVVAKVRYR